MSIQMVKAIFIVFLFFHQLLHAQENAQESLKAKLQAHFLQDASKTPTNFQITTDRIWYFAGDEIWFKVYLTTSGLPEIRSGVLYVDLTDSTGRILIKKKLLISDFGTAYGIIQIPKDYKSGWYSLGVQTEWNRNFNHGFEKLIYINVPGDLPRIISLTSEVPERDRVRFFPEGGNFVAGLPSRFAVSCINDKGNPEAVQVIVIDTLTKDTLVSFRTSLNGLGQFTLPPNYSQTIIALAKWPNGNTSRHFLPAMISKGITLQTSVVPERLYYKIESTRDFLSETGEILLTAIMHNEIVFSKSFRTGSELISFSNFIPLHSFPAGVISLRLYTPAGKLLAMRNVYHHKDRLPAIEKKLIGFESKSKNEITISLPDTLYGTYSVSITDADLMSQDVIDLKNKEKIILNENPFSLFQVYKNLGKETDLYLLTRDNTFKQANKSDSITGFKFTHETGINITGKVYYEKSEKQISGKTVNFFPKNQVSGNFLLTDTLDSKGNFELQDLFLIDSTILYWNLDDPDKKDVNKLRLTVNQTWFDSLRSRPTIISEKKLHKKENAKVAIVQTALDKYYLTDSLLHLKVKTLKEVTVYSKMRDRIQELEEKYVGASLFSGKLGFALAFDVEEEKGFYFSIFSYLQTRVPGLKILRNPVNPLLIYRSPLALVDTLTNVAIFLNDTRVEAGDVASIPVTEIAYLKVFRPPFSYQLAPDNGPEESPPISLVIAIYLRKETRKQETILYPFPLKSFIVKGFSLLPQFPTTDYSTKSQPELIPDRRITLFWSPELEFINGKANILFYNNDFSRRYLVRIDGINEAGEVIQFSQIIER